MRKQKVWVDMTAVDKMVGPPPCKKDGEDCPLRYPGCSGKCERFAAWQDTRKREREAYYKENRADLDADNYRMESYHDILRHQGKKVMER